MESSRIIIICLSFENKTNVYKQGVEKHGRNSWSINVIPYDCTDKHDSAICNKSLLMILHAISILDTISEAKSTRLLY